MVGSSISDERYTYIHDSKWPSEAADVHHIVVRKSSAKGFLVYLSALLILANGFHLFLVKDKSIIIVFWSFLLDVFLVKLMLQKPVKKESVIVMPAFGIQLETHYVSGKTIRRFVPIDKILKPTLSECVTPVTCYWSLSFIVRGEAELMLAFKELRPPVKMLVPIWKALCAVTGSGGSFDTLTDDGPWC
ncbi:uncharacterized protein LOC132171325 [Corylus avellana]|uniref:uncharacterized protein LOC132171325 n=1 Tax=Corylus avellana TaxID=13451 RepID=UPI001E21B893|nr:uncharacterized protein LOC132171325 [Corylus avellana]XP_059438598.1 uncharacterized protein LOC132171325 [Corylus avellana]